MKELVYKFYDELPLFLNAETVANLLGISHSNKYVTHEKSFPVLKIGSQLVVPKEKFSARVEQNRIRNFYHYLKTRCCLKLFSYDK